MKTLEEIAKEIAALSAQLAELGAQVDRYALPTLFAADDAEQDGDEPTNSIPAPVAPAAPKYARKYGAKRYIQGEERQLCKLAASGIAWQEIADQMVACGFPRRTPDALARKVSELRTLTRKTN